MYMAFVKRCRPDMSGLGHRYRGISSSGYDRHRKHACDSAGETSDDSLQSYRVCSINIWLQFLVDVVVVVDVESMVEMREITEQAACLIKLS
jgi:hypothetical protein